jgi:hypothetical protein
MIIGLICVVLDEWLDKVFLNFKGCTGLASLAQIIASAQNLLQKSGESLR